MCQETVQQLNARKLLRQRHRPLRLWWLPPPQPHRRHPRFAHMNDTRWLRTTALLAKVTTAPTPVVESAIVRARSQLEYQR